MTSYRGSSDVPPGTVTRTNLCDKTEKEIREYEQAMRTTATSGNITVSQSASCVR